MRGELEEKCVQRASIVRVERCEEVVFDLRCDRTELPQLGPSSRREADDVASAIDPVSAALDQALRLELVEQADEVAPVEPESIGDGGLSLPRPLGEKREHGVVQRAELACLERLDRPVLDKGTQTLEEERRAPKELTRRPDLVGSWCL